MRQVHYCRANDFICYRSNVSLPRTTNLDLETNQSKHHEHSSDKNKKRINLTVNRLVDKTGSLFDDIIVITTFQILFHVLELFTRTLIYVQVTIEEFKACVTIADLVSFYETFISLFY